ALGVDASGISDGDIAGVGCGLHFTGSHDGYCPASLKRARTRDSACLDDACGRVEFGIAADVTDFKISALAAQFSIPADVSGLDEAALSDDRGLAFDVSGVDETA